MPASQLGSGQSVPFYDFAPDLDPTTPGIILDSASCVPTIKGYKARNAVVQYAPALPAAPLGGYVALYADGTVSVIAATAAHIYRLVTGAWVVADATGPFSGVTHAWNFAQFADDVIATNPDVTAMQVAAGTSGTFGALGGTPPSNAVTVISVAGFAAAYKANQWFNSSAGTDIGWPPSVQTQSASGFLYDFPGNIVAAAAFFRTQIVWKQQAMWLLNYIGGDQVWASQILSNATGTWGQGCVVSMPEAVAFLGTDDFYITQGYAPTRIPNNLKEWFFDTADPTQLPNVTSWYDPVDSVAYWHFVSLTPSFAGVPDMYVGWNTRANRWTVGHLNTPLVVGNTQPGLSSGLYFDTNYVLQAWTGAPTTMMLLTGYQGDANKLSQLLKVRATYNAGFYPTNQSLIPFSVYILGQPDTVGTPGVLAQDSWFNVRQLNRYHRVQLNTVGAAEAMGLAIEGRVSGVR